MFLFAVIVLSLVFAIMLIATIFWVFTFFMTSDEECNNRVWVTFWQFLKVFRKYEDEFYSSRFWMNDILGPGHDMDDTTVKINDNLYYFYTPVGYLMYTIHRIWFARKHNEKKAGRKKFTTYRKIKENL